MALPGVSFSPGLRFEDDLRASLGLPISLSPADSFALVAAFGRCKHRLSISTVGLLLQASIGGNASFFKVAHLSDRVFKFHVASKEVGLFVRRSSLFECDQFKVFFHLWGDGGPNWRSEYKKFLEEDRSSWQTVPSLRSPVRSFADAVRQPARAQSGRPAANAQPQSTPLSGANLVPLGRHQRPTRSPIHGRPPGRKSVFDRVIFPAPQTPSPPRRNWSSAQRRHGGVQRRHGGAIAVAGPCSKCLLPGHVWRECRWPIRCRGCRISGHALASCPARAMQREHGGGGNNGKAALSPALNWFRASAAPGCSSPPTFNSFGEFAKALLIDWAPPIAGVTGPFTWARPISPSGLDTAPPVINADPVDPVFWSLAGPSSPPTLERAATPLPEVENHRLELQCNSPRQAAQCNSPRQSVELHSPAPMAFQRVDPRPFVPRNLIWQDVVNRPTMVRAVASRRSVPTDEVIARNDDLAIVTLGPLPGNALDFAGVDEVLRIFFAARGIRIIDIQDCSLGQAYVRFARPLDRDVLIEEGPIHFGNLVYTFVRHDEGRNWRRVYFNTECWIMMLGFPPNFQEEQFFQDAIGSFGRFLYWQEGDRRLTRVIIRARVLDLQSIPYFILFSEAPGFEGQSWTVQCEVLQHNLLGGGPADEDPVPDLPLDGVPFDFFGLGQPGAGPVQQEGDDDPQDQEQEMHLEHGLQIQQAQMNDAAGWDLWPDQNHQQIHLAQDLNQAPQDWMEIDLNVMAQQDEDNPQEVILNPATPPQGDFIELNDLLDGNNVVEEILIEHDQMALLDDEQNLMALADEEMQLLAPINIDAHADGQLPDNLGNFLDDEVPLEQLVDLEAALPDNPGNFLGDDVPLDQPVNLDAVLPDNLQDEQILENQLQPDLKVQHNGQQNDNGVLNVGMALTFLAGPDPSAQIWERARAAEATRIWARFFSPGRQNSIQVSIPSEWATFFTAILVSPGAFDWAKEFLSSKAGSYLEGNNGLIDYSLPAQCPANDSLFCCSAVPPAGPNKSPIEKEQGLAVEMSTAGSKKKGRKAPMVVTEVRRSPRLQTSYKESKPVGCADKRCIACSPSPPTLSPNLIKNLGMQFCDMDPELLDGSLKREKKVGPIAKKRRTAQEYSTSKKDEAQDKDPRDEEEDSSGQLPQ